MSDRNRRIKQTGMYQYDGSEGGPEVHIAKEKQKARELRHSAWWKKKTSSGICYYCGQKFLPAELTMDHKIPLSRGGFSEKLNIVPCCKECNNRKKYLMPVEWDEYMKGLEKPIGE